MITRELICKRLLAARGDRNRKKISEQAGFGPTTYGRWEDGDTAIGAMDLARICVVLGVHPADILASSDEADPLHIPGMRGLIDAVSQLHSHMQDATTPVAQMYAEHADQMYAMLKGYIKIPDNADMVTFETIRHRPKKDLRKRLPVFNLSKASAKQARGLNTWFGNVAAGHGAEVEKPRGGFVIPDLVDAPNVGLCTVVGASMEDTLRQGDHLVVQHFPPIVLARLDDDSQKMDLDRVRAQVPHGQMAIIDLNNEGPSVKRTYYQQAESGDWSLLLDADNEAWAHDNGYPRHVRKTDELIIYARILGLAK